MQYAPTQRDRSDGPSVLPVAGKSLVYGRDKRTIIDNVDIEIGLSPGIVVVLGPNGAGKSVLFRLLAGLLAPDDGSVSWDDMPPDRTRAHKIGFVFQRPVMLRRSVLANVEYVLAAAKVPRMDRALIARDALEQARLSEIANSPARTLSGGDHGRRTGTRRTAGEAAVGRRTRRTIFRPAHRGPNPKGGEGDLQPQLRRFRLQ